MGSGCEKIGYGGLFQQVSSVNATDISNNLVKLSNGVETFRSSGWAPVVSSNQDGDFLARTSGVDQFANHSFPCVLKGQTISCPSGEVFSNMMHSFEQNSGFHQIFSSNRGTNACQVSENGAHRSSSAKGKRKSSEEVQLRDSTMEVVDGRENCSGLISQGKQVKDNKLAAGKAEENYVHVRAKRGQATNSHSLAERVRRERISERMKMLQDLVPGCNKITGKAVMLDEIINYVQSLQQQVEFLSMKLATLNSELNMDLDLPRILPNEFFHPQSKDAAILGAHPELSFLQTFQGTTNVTMNSFSGTNTPFHRLPPNPWNNELQNIPSTTRFDSDQSVKSLTPNRPS